MIVGSLVIALIAVAALVVIVRTLRSDASPLGRYRAVPFAICAALSVGIALRAPKGRKPFSVDFSVVREDLARSMTKVPHLVGVAVLFLLAVIAFGPRHLFRAFVAVMILGVVWELAEATAIGHYARLADLAPNLTGALFALALVAMIRRFIE